MADGMRQRRGHDASRTSASSSSSTMESMPVTDSREAEQALLDAMQSLRGPEVIGLSNKSKKFKDEVTKDPYNVELLYKLGESYAEDRQWSWATNILQRGYKQVNKLPEEERLNYLLLYCEGVLNAQDYPKALEVMEQVCPPVEGDPRYKKYHLLGCQAFCHMGDMSRGLKCYHAAIAGDGGFENAAAVFVICQPALRKCGAFDVAMTSIQSMITNDEMQQRFDVLQKLSAMRTEFQKQQPEDLIFGFSKFAVYTFAVVFTIAMLILGYYLESRSLAHWEAHRAAKK